jgi:hypothetical protein
MVCEIQDSIRYVEVDGQKTKYGIWKPQKSYHDNRTYLHMTSERYVSQFLRSTLLSLASLNNSFGKGR